MNDLIEVWQFYLGPITITMEPQKIRKKIEDAAQYIDEDDITAMDWRGNNIEQFCTTEDDARSAYLSLLKDITYDKIDKLIKENVVLTKRGTIAKNRNHVLMSTNIPFGYNSDYGSHKWNEHVLMVTHRGEIVFTEKGYSSTF